MTFKELGILLTATLVTAATLSMAIPGYTVQIVVATVGAGLAIFRLVSDDRMRRLATSPGVRQHRIGPVAGLVAPMPAMNAGRGGERPPAQLAAEQTTGFARLLDELLRERRIDNRLHRTDPDRVLTVDVDPSLLTDPTTDLADEDLAGIVRVHPRALASAVRARLSRQDRGDLHKALAPDWPLRWYTPSALGAAQVIERATARWQTEPEAVEPFLGALRSAAAKSPEVDSWLCSLVSAVSEERIKALRNNDERVTEWRAGIWRTAIAFSVIESNPLAWTVSENHTDVIAWTAAVDEVSQVLARTLGGGAEDPKLHAPARRPRITRLEHQAILEQQYEQWPRSRAHAIARAMTFVAMIGMLVGLWFWIGQHRPALFAVAAPIMMGSIYFGTPSVFYEPVPRRVYGDRPRLSLPLSPRRAITRNAEVNGEIQRLLTALDREEKAPAVPAAPSPRETPPAVAAAAADDPDQDVAATAPVPSASPRDLREARQRAARATVVREGLRELNDQWLAYLLNKTEVFELPRLRDEGYPPTSRYRHALADLADAVDDLWNQPTEEQVAHAEHALAAADEAWRDARIAAAEAGQKGLPEREQRALRRAAHHLAMLEDPNLLKAARVERLAQLRHELDKLGTVPLSFDRVLQMPALEHVARRELNQ